MKAACTGAATKKKSTAKDAHVRQRRKRIDNSNPGNHAKVNLPRIFGEANKFHKYSIIISKFRLYVYGPSSFRLRK
jgi:hypothetical protein